MSEKPWKPLLPPRSLIIGGLVALMSREFLKTADGTAMLRNVMIGIFLIAVAFLIAVKVKIEEINDINTKVTYDKLDSKTKTSSLETVSTKEYDNMQLVDLAYKLLSGSAFSAAVFLGLGYMQPFIVQISVQLYQILVHPLISIHLLGRQAKGELRRPFVIKKENFKEDAKEHTDRIKMTYNYMVKGENPYATEKPLAGKDRRKKKRQADKANPSSS